MKISITDVLIYVVVAWVAAMAAVCLGVWKWEGSPGIPAALVGGGISLAATVIAATLLVRGAAGGLANAAKWMLITAFGRIVVVPALAVAAMGLFQLTMEPLFAGAAGGYLAALAGESVAMSRQAGKARRSPVLPASAAAGREGCQEGVR